MARQINNEDGTSQFVSDEERCDDVYDIPLGTVLLSNDVVKVYAKGAPPQKRSYAYVGRHKNANGIGFVFYPVGDMGMRLEYRVTYAPTAVKKFPSIEQYRKK